MRFVTRHPVFLSFLIGIAVLGFVVYGKLQQDSGPSGFAGRGNAGPRPVEVEEAILSTVADRVESIGTASANESINITAKVSETVTKVHFQDGDFVQAGDLLVELTSADEASRLEEAMIAAADARRQYERLQNLVQNRLVSNTDLDLAETAMKTAQARLEGVMVAMEDRLVKAPFSGILGFRAISEGTLLSPTTLITTLDDISVIKLDFTIPERYLADVKPGLGIRANSIVYGDRQFQGKVEVVGSRVDPVTRSVPVRAHIENTDGALRPGMLLTIAMGLNEHQGIVIPEQAVVTGPSSQYVLVVDENSVAQRQDVVLGQRAPGQVEILSGLLPGQRVITLGVNLVRPGETVEVVGGAGRGRLSSAGGISAGSASAF